MNLPRRHSGGELIPSDAPEARSGRWRSLLSVVIGLALLGGFIAGSDLKHVGDHFRALGWTAPLVLLPYGVIALVDTLGWRCTLASDVRHRVSLASFYLIRMAGEAVNGLTPAATVGGEPVKVHLLRGFRVSGSEGTASVVVARTALTVSQSTFVALGTGALFLRLDRPLLALLWLVVLLLLVGLFAQGLLHLQKRGLAVATWRFVHRLAPWSHLVSRLEHGAAAVDRRLSDFHRFERATFALATTWHFLGWLLGVVEIQFMTWLMGAPVGFLEAFIIEALAQPIRAAALVIPGGLGVQEWGGMWLCTQLGMTGPDAVTLWLLKRGRETVFDLIGLAYLGKRTYLD